MELLMRPLEPVDWNRAEGDEAEEEDVVEIPAPIFNPSDVPTTSCNGLFVAPYGAGSAFLEAQLPRLTTKAAGSLVLPKVPGSLGNNKDSTCRLYLDTNNNNLYAVCHDSEIDIHRAYAWTEALFKHIQPKFVVIFESLKYSQYKGDSIDITPPLLRVLQTDKQKVRMLQPPNLKVGKRKLAQLGFSILFRRRDLPTLTSSAHTSRHPILFLVLPLQFLPTAKFILCLHRFMSV
eukprot:GEZU01025376.1.p1 GENE.GEZU01025376.1~~GEZU01025376.1.p1  ORF type:complete len:234 (-),score=11.64 GEZU01025376.1:206-907(-)